MSIAVKCPGCGSSYDLHDSLAGKKVHCKKCEETFLVKAKAAARAVEDDDEELEEEERVSTKPRRPASLRDDDEADDRPRKRRRYEDDDEDDDLPRRRRKRKKSGAPVALIVGGIVGGIFLLMVVGFGAYFLLNKKSTTAQAANNPPPNLGGGGGAGGFPNVNPGGGAPAGPNVNPGGPQPGGAGQLALTLSNGRTGRGLGARKSFTVDYRFNGGGPAIGMHYFLIIKPSRGAPGEASFNSLRTQGTLQVDQIGFGALNETGPYELYMEMSNSPFGGGFGGAARQRVSNSITVN